MALPTSSLLPHIRRVVTAHDEKGVAVTQSDAFVPSEAMELVPGARGATMWVVRDGLPTGENVGELVMDGARRQIENPENFNLLPPGGTNLRLTELAPGTEVAMHRTSSLDYNILVAGELVLITEDGTETRLSTPGDTVVQRGTLHAWRNPSTTQWTRWVTVLMAATPAIVGGTPLLPIFVDTTATSTAAAAPAGSGEAQTMTPLGDLGAQSAEHVQAPSQVGA